ncbi:histidine phosphatase family protein [Fictibacillus nanhaiensis]|uniref:histidine phosphatase family protein n=1 Tax=Fictibacillus nanhaiensis TaxID=742169 RepID=UPI001C982E8D|nr:histidine phosphatase family protein [Fictibacillus nanhaiensis]MBY6037900.1 histidine phosphatase family protein [Fictibacillus nanhaiensis]
MKIVIVRHCQAEGQESHAPLTEKGKEQAKELASFLNPYPFDLILSSPFLRAIDTIKPFAEMKQLNIETDDRLKERILSAQHLPDWRNLLKRTYKEEHLTFPGGESTYEAKQRVKSLIKDIQNKTDRSVLLVTHGNLMSLMINLFEPSFGYEEWALLSNPDVYSVELSNHTVTKLWVS